MFSKKKKKERGDLKEKQIEFLEIKLVSGKTNTM